MIARALKFLSYGDRIPLHLVEATCAGYFVQRIPYSEFPSVVSIFPCGELCSAP